MTLKEKLEVLEELESGKSAAEVGRRHDVNESTIRSIRKIGDKIRTSVRSSTDPLSPPVINTQEKVEHEEEKEDSDDSITY